MSSSLSTLNSTMAAPSFKSDSPSIIVPSCFDAPIMHGMFCYITSLTVPNSLSNATIATGSVALSMVPNINATTHDQL